MVRDDLLGGLLKLRVEGREDPIAALPHRVGSELLLELAPDELGEVGVRSVHSPRGRELDFGRGRLPRRFGRDRFDIHEVLEHG